MKSRTNTVLASKTPIYLQNLQEVKPFTYFKDAQDYIYWAHRYMKLRGTDGLWATLVYSPNNEGDRFSSTANKQYSKTIVHGFRYEFPQQMRDLPAAVADKISARASEHPITGEQFLFVPANEITEIYDHRATLERAINSGGGSSLCEDVRLRIVSAVELLEKAGVPSSDIGLYGALQCGIDHGDQSYSKRDIDLLIYGTKHYEAVMSIAPGSTLKTPTPGNPNRARASMRRRELTQPVLSDFPDTTCDIRMMRTIEDVNSFPPIKNFDMSGPQVSFKGVVVSANESLVTPYVYIVKSKADKKEYLVCGRYYDYLGAATHGDEVEVFGRMVAKRTVLIANPETDYIKTIN